LANASALSPNMSIITTAIPHVDCISLPPLRHLTLRTDTGKFRVQAISSRPAHLANFIAKPRSFKAISPSQEVTMTEVHTPIAPSQQLEETGKAQYSFNFSDFLRREYRFGLDPNRPSCKAYLQGHCPLGSRCPDKHHVSSSYNKCVPLLS
jgi:hypothetical protein